MSASFPPMMFSMEELVGVVKLIIQMESAVANDNEYAAQKQSRHKAPHNKSPNHKNQHREPPNIQRWIARRSKRDILFLLASISGVKMKIYSLPSSASKHKASSSKRNGRNTRSVIKERVCRVSMDGKYLSMGEDCMSLDKGLEISLGIDLCYNNVRVMLKQLGLYNYYTHTTYDSTSSGSGSGMSGSYHSSGSSSMTDEMMRSARNKLSGNDKLKPKHCITVHDPITSRTLILQLCNCADRTMWAKGLCHLKHLNQKARNFRWTVVAYLISKYASTLNAHSRNNLNAHSKGLKSVSKGLNALKMGLTGGHKKASKGSKGAEGDASAASHYDGGRGMSGAPCYFEPFVQLIKVIGAQGRDGIQPKYPRRYNEMYKRRQNRLKHNQSNYEQFGENDLMYDPNKARACPEDRDVFYE